MVGIGVDVESFVVGLSVWIVGSVLTDGTHYPLSNEELIYTERRKPVTHTVQNVIQGFLYR